MISKNEQQLEELQKLLTEFWKAKKAVYRIIVKNSSLSVPSFNSVPPEEAARIIQSYSKVPRKSKKFNELYEKYTSIKNALILHLKPAAGKIANKYFDMGALNKEDCFQNAIIGVIEAIDRFHISKINHFFAYVHYWIRDSVYNGIAKLKRPASVCPPYLRLFFKFTEYIHKHGGVTVEELSEKLEKFINEYRLKGKQKYYRRLLASKEKLNQIFTNIDKLNKFSYLDEEVKIATEKDNFVDRVDSKLDMEGILKFLNRREANILKEVYGLDGNYGCPSSMAAVARKYGLSRERISQLVERSIKYLRKIARKFN